MTKKEYFGWYKKSLVPQFKEYYKNSSNYIKRLIKEKVYSDKILTENQKDVIWLSIVNNR